MLYAVLAVVLLSGLSLTLWLTFGPGPRRSRAFGRAQRLLESGAWAEALAAVDAQRGVSGLSEAWQGRLRNSAGECHQRAAEEALKEKRFEDALQHALSAAELLGQEAAEQRLRVQEAMLAEVRRLFASGSGSAETRAVLELLKRTFVLCGGGSEGAPAQPTACPEGWFWQGLCHVRQGQTETALSALTTAFEGGGRQVLDPAFYLGVLLHRQGHPQEALRYLGEANRVDATCPFVTWQMGVSLVAAGGDSGIAVRALQRALGPRGLSMWVSQPDRVWVEAFPEGRSYVRRLANRHQYHCPLLGRDLPALIRQGQLALAQALYRQAKFAEAAELFGKLLQDLPPTVTLLRGYGLSLARLGQYDQAYKHLRAALDQEEPKDPLTAGYLAVCGALGKPTQPEDKPKNVLWAVRLLGRYPLPGNAEWAGLIGTVHAEARGVGLALGVEDQLLLCETLASVQATDRGAASAYAHLAATFPDAVRPPLPYLYARARGTLRDFSTPQDLDLFARAFRDAAAARDYFSRQQWDLDEVEYTYLECGAARAPGRFPEALGDDYPLRGEAFLLERSRREEAAGRKESARVAAEVLLRLSPESLAAHDRLACLCYRSGEAEQAVTLLGNWHRLAPSDHWPLVRQAIIEQERGNAERRADAIGRALGLTRGALRSSVAFLGARLALREGVRLWGQERVPGDEARAALGHSRHLLQACLRDDPDHTEALWCLAAVRSVLGDLEGLASQAPLMNRPDVKDARFHYLGAVCHLAAHDYDQALELGGRAALDRSLAVESHFVMAWAHLHQENTAAARQSLQQVAADEASPSAPYARALLGQLDFARGTYDDAIKWWNAIDARVRADWHLDEPLRQTVLLAGLQALEGKRLEQAAERFREAGSLGLRDRRLGGLIVLALVKAGQRLLYGVSPSIG